MNVKKMNAEEMNLDMMKRFMTKRHPGESYKINEYKTYYTIVLDKDKTINEPIVFSKKGALPILKTYAQMPREEGKVVYQSGGKDNGKK